MSGTRAGALKGWETRRLMHRPTKRNEARHGRSPRTMSERELYSELGMYNVSYHSERTDALRAELKRREDEKARKKERERQRRLAQEERERKRHVRGQSARAKAPVRHALANAEAARKHYWSVVNLKQRGRATWDDVRDAETAHRMAQDKHSEALRTYYEKYGQHYVN